MPNINLRDLTLAGWCLAVVPLLATVLLCIPIGAWALDSIDNTIFRGWSQLICIVLVVPGVLLAMLVFASGSRVLLRAGVHVRRSFKNVE